MRINVLKVAREVATELGEGWTAREGYHSNGAFLDGPDGESLGFYLYDGRIRIDGNYQGYEAVYYRFSDGDPEITVSPTKEPRLMARDINRRLMGRYLELLAVLRERKAKRDEQAAREAAAIERLRGVLPNLVNRNGGSTHDFGGYGLVQGEARYYSGMVKLKVELPEEYALEVAEVIASIHKRVSEKA